MRNIIFVLLLCASFLLIENVFAVSCGSANNGWFDSVPSDSQLCTGGYALKAPSYQAGYWYWQCYDGGHSYSGACTAYVRRCGYHYPSNTDPLFYNNPPTSNLCSPNATFNAGSMNTTKSAYDWTCYVPSVGDNFRCVSWRYPKCGANAKNYSSTDTSFVGPSSFNSEYDCEAGMRITDPGMPLRFPAVGSSVSWVCVGVDDKYPTTCTATRSASSCTWSCSNWGDCQSNSTKYRTCSSSPAGCTGSNPYTTSEWCNYVPPTPTCNYTCSYGACESGNRRYRTCTPTNSPCTGGTNNSGYVYDCTYTPSCTWSCGEWGACQSSNLRYRTCSPSPAGCTGSNPYTTTQSCTYLGATIVSHNIPSSMTAGESKSVSVTVRNTGEATWNSANSFRLGGVGDGSGEAAKFGVTRVNMASGVNIAQNQEYTFTFTIKAPSTAGNYIPQYRMVQDGVAWFGNAQSVLINVVNETPPPVPTSLTCSAVTSTRIDCSWTASTGAVSYELQRAGVTIQNTLTLSRSDTGLTCATSYTYRVRACKSGSLCSAWRNASAVSTMACPINLTWFGQIVTNPVAVQNNVCTWTCDPWSTCVGGTQTRVCTSSPAGCTGANPNPTTQPCTNINLTEFRNPLDLVQKAATTDQKEQCLWCDYYYQDGDTISSGKLGALDFQFRYAGDAPMKSYSMMLTSSNANPNSAAIPASEKIEFTENLSKPTNSLISISGISVSRTVSKITGRTIPYDGKTYHWWIKVSNNNETSQWIPALKDIIIPDHQWPMPAIGGLVETRSSTNQALGHTVCSTMVNVTNPAYYKEDPCYSSCWSDYALGTAPIVGDSKWKCSVCYDTTGKAVLCNINNFEWRDISSAIGTFNTTTNIYKEKRKLTELIGSKKGKQFFNPLINFSDSSGENNVLRFKVVGSECPLQASVNAKKIRPIWVE